MKIKILLITLFFSSIKFVSQNNKLRVYFDENNNQISMLDYIQKCNSFLYKCSKKENDSLQINSTFLQFKFGQLSKKENNQLRKYLAKRTNNDDLLGKTIVINHKNKLLGFKNISQDTIEKYRLRITKDIYDKRNKNIDKYKKKCHKLVEKNKAIALNTYIHNLEYTYQPKNYKWIKANMLSFIFSDKSGILVLKPNGEYFLNQGYIHSDYIKNLLKNKDWNTYINEYKFALNNPSKKRTSFFELSRNSYTTRVYVKSKDLRSKTTVNQMRKALRRKSPRNVIISDSMQPKRYMRNIATKISDKCYTISY